MPMSIEHTSGELCALQQNSVPDHLRETLKQIPRPDLIGEMIDREPELIQWFALAASKTDGRTRWQDYSILKRQCSQYVGWDARNPALQSSEHYEAMIWVLDLLLPDALTETPQDSQREEEVA